MFENINILELINPYISVNFIVSHNKTTRPPQKKSTSFSKLFAQHMSDFIRQCFLHDLARGEPFSLNKSTNRLFRSPMFETCDPQMMTFYADLVNLGFKIHELLSQNDLFIHRSVPESPSRFSAAEQLAAMASSSSSVFVQPPASENLNHEDLCLCDEYNCIRKRLDHKIHVRIDLGFYFSCN